MAGKVSSKANEEGANQPVTSSLQGSSSSAAQAMDESTRPEHERPATEDSSRAPKHLLMNVISYADMREDMEPNLSQDAFGEDVFDSLETYDFNVEDDEDWDYMLMMKMLQLQAMKMTPRSSCTRMTRKSLS